MTLSRGAIGSSFLFCAELESHASLQKIAKSLASSLKVPVVVDHVGGSALGFLVASIFSDEESDVEMPRWTIATREELADLEVRECVGAIVREYGALLSKHSGTRESFSPHSSRGANTSRGSHFHGLGEEEIGALIEAAGSGLPHHRAQLFQGLIEPSRDRPSVHMYVQNANVDVELIYGDERVLARGSSSAGDEWENTSGGGVSAEKRAHAAACISVARRFAQWAAPRFPEIHDWNLEGEWDDAKGTFWIFQSRPTPTDRPQLELLHEVVQNVYSTRFVWGVFDVDLSWGSDGPEWRGIDEVYFLEPECDRSARMEAVTRTLRAGASVLVLDSDSAFRLSHEPDHLPISDVRHLYRYLHLPPRHLAAFRIGERRVRIVSDGERCQILEAKVAA